MGWGGASQTSVLILCILEASPHACEVGDGHLGKREEPSAAVAVRERDELAGAAIAVEEGWSSRKQVLTGVTLWPQASVLGLQHMGTGSPAVWATVSGPSCPPERAHLPFMNGELWEQPQIGLS